MTGRQFRRRLILGVVLLNLSVSGVVFAMLRQSAAEAKARAEIATATLAEVVEQNIADAIAKIDLALLTSADEIQRQEQSGAVDVAALNAYLAKFAERLPEIASVRIADADGLVKFGRNISAADEISVSDRDYFTSARDGAARLIISDPLLGRASHVWALFLARRYALPGQRFSGIVFADLPLSRLAGIFAGMAVGPHGSVTLWNRDLKIVARYPEPEGLSTTIGLQGASRELTRLVASGATSGTYHAVSRINASVERQLSFRKIAGYPFYVTVGQAPVDFMIPWWHEAYRLLAFSGLFALVSVAGAWLLDRSFRRQRLSARALAAEQSLLRALIDAIPDGIFVKNREGRYTVVNDGFARLLDLPQSGILNRNSHEVLAPSVATAQQALDQAVTAERRLRIDGGSLVRKDGRIMRFETTRAPLIDADGEALGLIGVVRDVTEQKRAEAELRQSLDDLRIAQASLVQQEKLAALGQITAGIAHEIQNPLNFVNNFATVSSDLVRELADLETLPPDEVAEIIAMLTDNMRAIAEHGARAAGIVRGMQAHVRSSAGEIMATNLGQLLRDSLEKAAGRDPIAGITIEWRLADDLLPVPVNPIELGMVFTNLIKNALYALEARRRWDEPGYVAVLTLGAGVANGQARICIRDNGTGIPEAARPKLFTPFFTTKPSGEGTGLGLSLSFEIIVKRYRGGLAIRSEEGVFTEAVVTLALGGSGQ